MEWQSFVDWALKGLIGGTILYAVHLLAGMKTTIDSLNAKVARIVERTGWHTKEIEKLGSRCDNLDNRYIKLREKSLNG